MKQSEMRAEFVEFIPEKLNEGVLYISEKYKTAAHKCCCGCGEEVITPLTPADWSIYREGNAVSMHPSIGNWNFACQSHYWIKKNRVVWARGMSKQEIEHVRKRDRKDKEAYIAYQNLMKEQSQSMIHKWINKALEVGRALWTNIQK